MRKVLVFGTFDRLHEGHVRFLEQARRHGDFLIAVVTRDENVVRQKGHMPAESCSRRAANVRKFADKVLVGEREVSYRLIKRIDPDVICIGYDQRPSVAEARKILAGLGMGKVALKRMRPHRPGVYKSSILNKARKAGL